MSDQRSRLAREVGKHELGRIRGEVRVTGLDDAVRVAVHNEGPPIPEDVLPRIFDPFWRAEDRADRAGLGLGLHIVYNLVTRTLHGRIAVESRDGEGTTFILRFPRVAPAEPAGAGERDDSGGTVRPSEHREAAPPPPA